MDEAGAFGTMAGYSALTPLAGRAAELAQLDRLLDRAVALQAPQLVTLVGTQGLGKSRLLGDWIDSLGARRPTVRAYRAEAAARGATGTGTLAAQLLRARFGLGGDESGDEVAAILRAELAPLFGDPRLAEVIHFLGRWIGASHRGSPFLSAIEGERGGHEAIARTVLRRFLALDAARSPLVLVVDDLHRADDDSLSLLKELAEGLGGSPVLILSATRPELFVRGFQAGGVEHTRIELGPLGRAEAERVLRHLLRRVAESPPSVIEHACALTAGSPLLLEELVRSWVGDGILAPAESTDDGDEDPFGARWTLDAGRARRSRLPISIEEAVEVRIGSLSRDERDLLEKAATFGNVFWTGALTCMRRLDEDVGSAPAGARPGDAHRLDDGRRAEVERCLHGLTEQDYLLEIPDSPIPGEREFAFKHNLERELVARMTPPERARKNHLFGAQWLEARLPDHSEEQLEFLASLYARGGSPRRAATAYVAAGDRARARHAIDTALDLYQKGLALLDRDDALGRLDALHNLGDVTALAGRPRDALAHFEEMLRCAWLLDSHAKAGAAHGRIGRCYRSVGDFDKAEYHLGLALGLFTRAGDHRGVAAAEDDLGKVSFLRGDLARALERHGRALGQRRALGEPRSLALSLHNLAQVQRSAGHPAQAMAHLDESIALRRAIGDRGGLAASLVELAALWAERGAAGSALDAAREAFAIARDSADRSVEAAAAARVGELLLASGRFDEAAIALRTAAEAAGASDERALQAEAARLLGETLLARGEGAAAEAQCEAALDLADQLGSLTLLGLAHRALGLSLSRDTSPDRESLVESHFRAAVELLEEASSERELARTLFTWADILIARGAAEQARPIIERAESLQAKVAGAPPEPAAASAG